MLPTASLSASTPIFSANPADLLHDQLMQRRNPQLLGVTGRERQRPGPARRAQPLVDVREELLVPEESGPARPACTLNHPTTEPQLHQRKILVVLHRRLRRLDRVPATMGSNNPKCRPGSMRASRAAMARGTSVGRSVCCVCGGCRADAACRRSPPPLPPPPPPPLHLHPHPPPPPRASSSATASNNSNSNNIIHGVLADDQQPVAAGVPGAAAKMLELDPKAKSSIEEVLGYAWMRGMEVC
ncbi:hypothetical protein C8J57DRAFT_1720305 [Mycena rebaudengoi]|nr:hypothetical protein C8J57DRAFT_1720305 [Mycena rebaudengoi]